MTLVLGVSWIVRMQVNFKLNLNVKGAINMVKTLINAIMQNLAAGTTALGGPVTRSQYQGRLRQGLL